jgi:hypothetical protein
MHLKTKTIVSPIHQDKIHRAIYIKTHSIKLPYSKTLSFIYRLNSCSELTLVTSVGRLLYKSGPENIKLDLKYSFFGTRYN